MKKLLLALLFLFLILPQFSFAANCSYKNWEVQTFTDAFTDEPYVSLIGHPSIHDTRITCREQNIIFEFDAGEFVDFGKSYVHVRVRVDSMTPIALIGQLDSTSNSAGEVRGIVRDGNTAIDQRKELQTLLAQMKMGQKLLIQVSKANGENATQDYRSLLGFAKAYNSVKNYCE